MSKLKEKKISKAKNRFTFFGIGILYLILPFLISIFVSNKIIDNYVVFFYLFGVELLTCFTTKKIVKNTKGMKKELVVLEAVLVIIQYILFFDFFLTDSVSTTISSFIILSLTRAIIWFVVRKNLIEEKMYLSKRKTLRAVFYLLFVFAVFNLVFPTRLNCEFYLKFGKKYFSSKQLQVDLIDGYNGYTGYNDYNEQNLNGTRKTYLHKLTKEELAQIKELIVNETLTNEEVSKLSNLTSLTFIEKTNSTLDFTKNKKLETLGLYGSDNDKSIENLYLPNSIVNIDGDRKVKNLDLSGLKDVSVTLPVENFTFKDKEQLSSIGILRIKNIKTLAFEDKSITLNSKTFDFYSEPSTHIRTIGLKKGTKKTDFNLQNLQMKVFDEYNNKEKTETETINNDDRIYIYDNNNEVVLIFRASVE